MKIIAENPETKEQFEAEIADLKPDDLKNLESLNFPDNKNPERTVRKYIENQDISADKKAQVWQKLKVFARATLRVGNKVLRIGRKMFDFVMYLTKRYPHAMIGAVFGAVVASLVSAIPVIGFLFGGLASLILPLVGGFLGYKEDLAAKGHKRRFFDSINDPSVEESIEKEVRSYEPLNTRSRSSGKSGNS